MNDVIGEENVNIDWMDEKVPKINGHNFLYNFICLFTFRSRRKITYKELFIIYYGIHRKKLGEHDSKEKALKTIIKIYMENNDGKKPEGI